MNKELKKEIEQAQNLSRRERRKIERKLQIKYKNKNIKIKSGKKFKKGESINRKQRRELLKNKDLLKEVIKIINKYFPKLKTLISKLTDKRHSSYAKYSMRTIIMTRLISLICGIISMNGMSRKFNTEEAINNLSKICNQELDEIPNWQTIQDVIEELDIKEIDNIRKYMVKALIRNKMFDRYRYDNCFQLIVDATGITSLE